MFSLSAKLRAQVRDMGVAPLAHACGSGAFSEVTECDPSGSGRLAAGRGLMQKVYDFLEEPGFYFVALRRTGDVPHVDIEAIDGMLVELWPLIFSRKLIVTGLTIDQPEIVFCCNRRPATGIFRSW